MSTDPIFSLPPYRIGPYHMQVVPVKRAAIRWARHRTSADWELGQLRMDRTLAGRPALEWFTRHLVSAIHYRSGLNDSCNEEAFTHSLATGIVELASDPVFWAAYVRVMAQELKPKAGWVQASAGAGPVPARPKRLAFGGRVCVLKEIPLEIVIAQRAYAFYHRYPGKLDDVIEVADTLHGPHRALIVLHEVLHFMHAGARLFNKTRTERFERVQASSLLRFVETNPAFWRWWLYEVQQPRVQEPS